MTLANYSNTKSHKKIIMGQFNRNPKFPLSFFPSYRRNIRNDIYKLEIISRLPAYLKLMWPRIFLVIVKLIQIFLMYCSSHENHSSFFLGYLPFFLRTEKVPWDRPKMSPAHRRRAEAHVQHQLRTQVCFYGKDGVTPKAQH